MSGINSQKLGIFLPKECSVRILTIFAYALFALACYPLGRLAFALGFPVGVLGYVVWVMGFWYSVGGAIVVILSLVTGARFISLYVAAEVIFGCAIILPAMAIANQFIAVWSL